MYTVILISCIVEMNIDWLNKIFSYF